jgi:beta-fructofuranosidase
MYSSSGYSDWEIGDIDVFIHQGVYHLFHLIIPNHDYIAHAISSDGISWKRIDNALFVGHPGSWDDDMLWTMHVTQQANGFKMFYTGLKRKNRGVVQKVGTATSQDLVIWEKEGNNFLLESQRPYYEDRENNPRKWLSWRDPFYFEWEGKKYLLICGRSSFGPVSRRGCVALVQLQNDQATFLPALIYPMVYDDVECPCVFQLKGRFYLVGSIREDIKVRYWFASTFNGEYHSFRADVLLPQGNYAARVVKDGAVYLIYNFFYLDGAVDTLRVLPPPKQLDVDEEGRLILKSFYRWDKMVLTTITQNNFTTVKPILNNPTNQLNISDNQWTIGARSSYEIFAFIKPSPSFIWEGEIVVEGMGKFGLVTDLDEEGNGYFISFDITNRVVKIRAWGFNEQNVQHNFIHKDIQSCIFKLHAKDTFHFQLIRYGNYIELSIDGTVVLTLIDYTYSNQGIGLYSASSVIVLKNSILKTLPDPHNEYGSQEEI